MRYFDASALAKRYVREKGSLRVVRLLSSDVSATSRLSSVEIVSALMRRVRERTLSERQRDRIMAVLETDMSTMLVVEFTPHIVRRAQLLLQRYPLRAGDAIQLASCLYLREELGDGVTLLAFDERLAAAARAEGVKVG